MSDSEKSGSEDSLEIETSRFNSRTKKVLRALYGNCCAFCLTILTVEAMECAEILDASEGGASEVASCAQFNIIPPDYKRQSLENGFILCLVCYPLFHHGYIALCPPDEVLNYLIRYVRDTPTKDQISLYQILHELTKPQPQLEGLPDVSGILPYAGLYSVALLNPSELKNVAVLTAYSPPLSIIHNGKWEPAPNQNASNDQNVARIYDPLAVNTFGQVPSPDIIPVHRDQPHYSPIKRYWRLQHVSLGGMLSAAILRSESSVQYTADELCTTDELKMVRVLHDILKTRKAGGVEGFGDGGGRGGGKG